MKVTKRQLRRIIRESCGEAVSEPAQELPQLIEPSGPCPYSTADQLKSSGMSDSEVLEWVGNLLATFLGGSTTEETLDPVSDFDFTGDVGELSGDEAFGIGYEAGTRGI